MLLLKKILSLLVISVNYEFENQEPLVNTKLGLVHGTWKISADGNRYASFTKVPYAKPPVGALRFEVLYVYRNFLITFMNL
jgi:hypothetical protein